MVLIALLRNVRSLSILVGCSEKGSDQYMGIENSLGAFSMADSKCAPA
jgi:hypothetical protein